VSGTALLIPALQAVTDTIRSAFDTARLVVLIAILVRRSLEPTGRGAASGLFLLRLGAKLVRVVGSIALNRVAA
jgi:hypothetical protein